MFSWDSALRLDRREQQSLSEHCKALSCITSYHYCIMWRNLFSSVRMFMEELMSPMIMFPAASGAGLVTMGGGITLAWSLGAPAAWAGGDLVSGLAPLLLGC